MWVFIFFNYFLFCILPLFALLPFYRFLKLYKSNPTQLKDANLAIMTF
ncbi:hypothetical protein KEC49_00135 ['Elaeagnus angustifolia' witches'-broom phytoplasma]|uniref:Uncharacterized protein n=1 Tax='Elaeagnus angustifolia' witches'-broom phytoplasma TaxID=1538355 RepID=A0ABS5V8B1_9MOLU|nr:hypothetical protein ['Elaeagnus angustifolia' witches'-broom phytoplasma]